MTYESQRGRIVPPNLDDRTWAELVQDMRGLIPAYAPQWTDQSPSDLGVTLIELFAWLAEAVIYRLNRTPEKNYLAFLDLLGITRDPATPARTYLTFTTKLAELAVPKGTQAQTATREGRPIAFETDDDVTVLPTSLTHALALDPFVAAAGAPPAKLKYRNVTATLVGPPTGKYLLEVPAAVPDPANPALVRPGNAVLFLGFDRAVTSTIGFGVRLYRALATSDQVEVTWSHSSGTDEPLAWATAPTGAVADGTDAFRHDGRVTVPVPATWTAQRAAGPPATKPWTTAEPREPSDGVADPRYWLALRVANRGGAPLVIGIDRLLFNAALASSALTVRAAEVLGTSTGGVFQVFPFAHRPVFRRPGLQPPYDHVRVQVGTGTPPIWADWSLVDDLPAGPAQVYRLNPVTGEISFGNYDPATGRGHGSVPPAGARIQALTYRYVDSGASGNVDAARLTVLGTLPSGAQPTGVDGVTNLGPGRDGADEEPIEETLRRAPEELKIRDRAVTADDYEFLVGEAMRNEIQIVRCLTPRLQAADAPAPAPLPWVKGDPWTFGGIVRAPGNVTLIVVPDQGPLVARPEPTPDQIRQVRAYLEPRRDLTAHLDVVGPRYLPVIVNVEVVVWQQAVDAGADVIKVRSDTLNRIKAFLHPTRGGPESAGWQVGQAVFTSDLFKAIMPADDLGYISSLQVKPDTPAYHFPPLNPTGATGNYDKRERPFDQPALGASVRVADYELVCAAADTLHQITSKIVTL